MKQLDVLLVQSHYDSATAVENADATFAALPHAYRVSVPNEFEHGVYPYKDHCVDRTVAAYLLGENPTERQINCKAHPLPLNMIKTVSAYGATALAATAYNDGINITQSPLPQDHPLRAYRDPALASALIKRFKNGLISPLDARH